MTVESTWEKAAAITRALLDVLQACEADPANGLVGLKMAMVAATEALLMSVEPQSEREKNKQEVLRLVRSALGDIEALDTSDAAFFKGQMELEQWKATKQPSPSSN